MPQSLFLHACALTLPPFANKPQLSTTALMLQLVTFGLAYWQLRTNASPGDRLRLLPVFFLGAAELASGVSGL